jgi:hypothetical protein
VADQLIDGDAAVIDKQRHIDQTRLLRARHVLSAQAFDLD